MMYRMKNIINHNEEIPLPKCMYQLKPIYTIDDCFYGSSDVGDEVDINVGKQVTKFLQSPNKAMAELERRQDHLLKKLDVLYNKIISISSACQSSDVLKPVPKAIATPDEIVLVVSPDNLPWFLNVILKKVSPEVNLTCHVHSMVPTEKVAKIKVFVKSFPAPQPSAKTNIRLIFQNVSADSELKLSSLEVPIIGTVNILRYIAMAYPSVVPYDGHFAADALLDLCHVLERTNEKNKEAVVKNLFSQYNGWLYNKSFSIVDVAAYNVIKQWRNCPKYVPKDWFDKCEKF